MIRGIDVSSYQQPTWSVNGLDFAFIKATEGHTETYASQNAHAARARGNGLVTGFYHFLWPGNIQAQAEYFVEKCASQEGDMLAIDWETTGDDTIASNAEKDQILRAVKALRPDHKVGLYTGAWNWKNIDKTSYFGDFLWIADYNGHPGAPGIKDSWKFHQYTSTPLDTNMANFASRNALKAWAEGGEDPHVVYESFPGAKWFVMGKKSPIVEAMHHRLVSVGCNNYQTSTNLDTIGTGDVESYEAWQRKDGFSGADAKWPPGKTSWDDLKVPKV